MGSDNTGQMGCTACTGNKCTATAFFHAGHPFGQFFRSAVSRQGTCFERNAKVLTHFCRFFHDVPIGSGTHDDTDQFFVFFICNLPFLYSINQKLALKTRQVRPTSNAPAYCATFSGKTILFHDLGEFAFFIFFRHLFQRNRLDLRCLSSRTESDVA